MWYVNARKFLSRLSFAIFVFSGLGGCAVNSFSNVDAVTTGHFQKMALPDVSTRPEQIMNRTLIDYIGSFDKDPHFQLSYKFSSANRSILSSAGVDSSLINTKMAVSYSLTDSRTGDVLTSGIIDAFATSGAISSYHGQDVSAEFATERLVKLLGERLYQKLQLYFLSLEV